MTSPLPRPPRRRASIATVLFVFASVCALSCAIGFVMLMLPSTRSFRNSLRTHAENADYPKFLVPGEHTLDLPEGMILVSYFTDHEHEDVRYQVPASLMFELSVVDDTGSALAVETDPSARATLKLDSDDVRKAVLVGLAEIPADGTYTIRLALDGATTNKAVAHVITMSATEREQIMNVMTYLGLGVCGGGGAVFFGVLGLGVRWAQKRGAVIPAY